MTHFSVQHFPAIIAAVDPEVDPKAKKEPLSKEKYYPSIWQTFSDGAGLPSIAMPCIGALEQVVVSENPAPQQLLMQ